MQSYKNILLNWVEELEQSHTPTWRDLPDIDLYMDQVITYLKKQLSVFSKLEDEKFITPAMINNYVKNEIIPPPVKKKYTREHISHLISVLNLKNILSLTEITTLISHETADKSIDVLFDQLNTIQNEAVKMTAIKVKEALEKLDKDAIDANNEEKLSLLALQFSLEANASRIAAKKILEELIINKVKLQENEAKEKSKNNGKDKNKERNK